LHEQGIYDLVDVKKVNPRIIVKNPYNTSDNVYGYIFYPSPQVYLLNNVARRLSHVQEDLEKEGLGLIVYEGYRPPSIQKLMDTLSFDLDESRRRTYPRHYRTGMGVDVSIYYLDGSPIQLPTLPGNTTWQAWRDFPYLPCHVFHNRSLLEKIMWNHGFVPMRERWWHFDARAWQKAPFLKVEYGDL
jgi:D-alanyl-D-alanine dipeptidase